MSLTYIYLGEAGPAPSNGELMAHEKCAPGAGSLYRARVEAVMQVKTEFFCLLDGGGDALLAGFEASIDQRVDGLKETGKHIAYADEMYGEELIVAGDFSMERYLRNPAMIHHGPVCRTSSAKSINWPSGCFWFEGVCYGSLAKSGWLYHPGAVYQWNRTPGGASQWPDTRRAIINTMLWHQGIAGLHIKSDF